MFIQTSEYEIPTAAEVADSDFIMEGDYPPCEIVIPADPFLRGDVPSDSPF